MCIRDKNRQLEELDKQYIWHPFTQMQDWLDEIPLIISEGKGSFLKDIYGKWYIDGVSSLWVNIHGHRRKEINNAIKDQLDKIAHSTLLGLGNIPSIKLAEKLVQLIKTSLTSDKSPNVNHKSSIPNKVFYSDNGSTSVEIALKMAFQYWKHLGIESKNTFLSLNNAYHGDTIGAVSVGGIDLFHSIFGPLLFKTLKAPSPYCYRCELGLELSTCKMTCLKRMEEILKENSEKIAAVILEPLIQAAGGMITSPPGYLGGIRELCNKYDTILIADEVATGFGRTGKMFACAHENVIPDIICLSKGITGGYLPLAITITSERIFNTFLGKFQELKTFFHGHSYTGNQLACAAAIACLEIFKKDDTINNLNTKINLLEDWLKEIHRLNHVGDTRNAGFMAGVELVFDKTTKEPYPLEDKMGWQIALNLREKGVLIRPLGNIIVIIPPLSISLENLKTMLDHIKSSIKEVTE